MTAADSIVAPHEYNLHPDPAADFVAELVESMLESGWIGAPILVYRIQGTRFAVTGTHRIAAAREADVEVPTLDLDDVTDNEDVFGLDGLVARLGLDNLSAARVAFALAFTDEQISEYGLDVDDIKGIVYDLTGRML